MKRLYIVTATVEIDYAVLAESAEIAKDSRWAKQAIDDSIYEYDTRARLASTPVSRWTPTGTEKVAYLPPEDWDPECLVYGECPDTTWSRAVDLDRKAVEAEAEAKRVAEFNARQVPLLGVDP